MKLMHKLSTSSLYPLCPIKIMVVASYGNNQL